MKQMDIAPLDGRAMQDARSRLDALAKPLGSLGRLEEYAVQLAGIRGYLGGTLEKRAVLVFAADNGVYAQEITPVPKSVTQAQTLNIANGIAGVNALANMAGAEVFVYNVGVELPIVEPRVVDALVMRGTDDMTQGPAMSRAQCERALATGYGAVEELGAYDVMGVGEMGICNTTTAAAVTACLLGLPAERVAGRGAGITDAHYQRKIGAIKRALDVNKPDGSDPIDVMAKVGGLDIAAMAGAYLACAHYRVPVVTDGFISACAALCAYRLEPTVKDYMFASHQSDEPGYTALAEAMGLEPALRLGMRLGEGSGCPLMFQVLEAALRVAEDMGTLEEGMIDGEDLVDIR